MNSKNNRAILLGLVLIAASTASTAASACMRFADSEIAIAGSYTKGQQVFHGANPDLTLGNCGQAGGEYLVFVTAPVYTDPQFKSISSAEGDLPEDSCYIDQSPFDVSKPQDIGIDSIYASQTKFLSTCLETVITDKRGEIDASTQINCEVSQTAKDTVVFRGPRCVVKIQPTSEFKVTYRMNSSCLDKNYLKVAGNIRPMDVKSSLEIYRTPDLTPGNPNYTILGMISGRITLQPDKDLLPVAAYTGTVGSEWPMQFGAKIEMGRIVLSKLDRLNQDPLTFLRSPFLVNNNCKEVCNDGLCSSPCDFFAPVAARMTLKKKAAGEDLFHTVDYWYQGTLVPPHFLGELVLGRQLTDTAFDIGDEFILTGEFSSPAMTYRTIIDEAKQLLIRIAPILIPTGTAGRPTGLPTLGTLGANMLPLVSTFPTLTGIHTGEEDINLFLDSLNQLIGTDDSWPPYYSTVINGDQQDSANRVFQTLQVSFRVASITPSGIAVIDHLVYSKKSKIFGNYSKPMALPPQVKCNMGPH